MRFLLSLLIVYCPFLFHAIVLAQSPRVIALPQAGQQLAARDTIKIGEEPNADARSCLAGLEFPPQDFSVDCEASQAWRYDRLVRFPSVIDTGDTVNDRVAMEWHLARDPQGELIAAPAILVVHESGRQMPVGKALAMLLSRHGMHAFLIHLPGYGLRHNPERPKGAANVIRLTRQAIMDVRRARDAIVVLPEVENRFVAVQGTSLGGFITATAASLDSSFDAVFLMLCGGDLYDVLENGKRDAANMRRQLANEGLAGDDLRELLQSIEPLRIAHRLSPQQTWLFSGQLDDVVPMKNANLLAQAARLTPEHHVLYDADHYSGVIYIPEMISRMQNEVQRLVEQRAAP